MIICRTPFRISFFGGGTDLDAWLRKKKGAVLNASIDKYCYITIRDLPDLFKYKYRLRYYKTEERNKIESINHDAYREVLKYLKFKLKLKSKTIEVVHHADIPSMSGLGSSSSSTVCFIHALHIFQNKLITKKKLSQIAINIEQKILKENVGMQDQISSSYGGLNLIKFKKKKFTVTRLKNKKNINYLKKNIIIFYSGIQRIASTIEKRKILRIKKSINDIHLNEMYNHAIKAFGMLNSKKFSLNNFAELINKSWSLKKKLSNEVSNKQIDKYIKIGLESGAIGAKLLGAGGGGFILFVCKKGNQDKVRKKLKNLKELKINFEYNGSCEMLIKKK